MSKNFLVVIVIFVVMLSSGCVSPDPPVARFIADPMTGYAPLNVSFTDSSERGGSEIISWDWEFGDGNTSSERNPYHVFEFAGDYNVVLSVLDRSEIGDSVSTFIQVSVPEINFSYDPPTASFIADVVEGPAPLDVNFIDASTKDNGDIYVWSWDFGDGNYSSEQDPSHIFENEGEYTVNLTVIDDRYNQDHFEMQIRVTPPERSVFINTTADTFVDETVEDSNFGARTYIQVNADCPIYLKFTDLPDVNTIVKAEVMVYNTYTLEDGPEVVAYTSSLTSWNENDITWNSRLTYSIGVLDTTVTTGSQQWFSWDVTNGVKEDINEDSITIVLVGSTSQTGRFFSKESESRYTARLELELSS